MAAPFIVAIDPATTTGICYGHVGAKPTLRSKRFSGRIDVERYGAATEFLIGFLHNLKPDLICMETPIHASNGKTNASTVEMTNRFYGALIGVIGAKHIPFKEAPISTWRKYFLGRGNLTTDEAKKQCVERCRLLGLHAPTHDAAEAAGIWYWAGSQIAPAQAQRTEPLFARAAA